MLRLTGPPTDIANRDLGGGRLSTRRVAKRSIRRSYPGGLKANVVFRSASPCGPGARDGKTPEPVKSPIFRRQFLQKFHLGPVERAHLT